jgi:hypothetical protein
MLVFFTDKKNTEKYKNREIHGVQYMVMKVK